VGGLRLNPMGSDEGGLEELVELSLSRASRSRTRCSSSRPRRLTESSRARMAIWASGGTVFQSRSGMGGRGIIALILRACYTKGSARERARWTIEVSDMNSVKRPNDTAQQPAHAGRAVECSTTLFAWPVCCSDGFGALLMYPP